MPVLRACAARWRGRKNTWQTSEGTNRFDRFGQSVLSFNVDEAALSMSPAREDMQAD